MRNRARLLQKVRAFWVEGVLHASLQGVTPLALRMEIRPDVVAQPWNVLMQPPDQATLALPAGTSIVEVYDRCGGELLILGDPGAGKTITMLELARGLLLGLGIGIFGAVIGGIIFGLSRRAIATRTTPNEGIWRSGRNALRIWLAIGASFGLGLRLLGWGIDGLFGPQSLDLWFWLLKFGLPLGFIYCAPPLALARGGLVWVQHFALRFVLWCSGDIPWSYADFLDYCVERVLLQRVGGGYIFIHRLLLEYFAALDTSKPSGDIPAPPAQREHVVGT